MALLDLLQRVEAHCVPFDAASINKPCIDGTACPMAHEAHGVFGVVAIDIVIYGDVSVAFDQIDRGGFSPDSRIPHRR